MQNEESGGGEARVVSYGEAQLITGTHGRGRPCHYLIRISSLHKLNLLLNSRSLFLHRRRVDFFI